MKALWKPVLLFGGALIASGGSAIAQNPPIYDPQQLPAQRGEVQQFTMTPRGDIDGLMLTDGTEVKTPPHLSTAMAFSIKPGDSVTVAEGTLLANPLGKVLEVHQIGASRDHLNEVQAPPGPGGKKGRRGPPSA